MMRNLPTNRNLARRQRIFFSDLSFFPRVVCPTSPYPIADRVKVYFLARDRVCMSHELMHTSAARPCPGY